MAVALRRPAPAARSSIFQQLKVAREAVEAAAAVSGAQWLSYVFVLLYLAVAAGSVTHVDLLLERSVKLPFLNIDLPLVPFFILAPTLFIIAHVYTLVYFVMLAAKLGRFNDALEAAGKHGDFDPELIRAALPSSLFIQFLAGPRAARRGLFGQILRSIAWITLVIAPVLLLLLMQAQFLPYHFAAVTWVQRLAVVADLIVLWTLWPAVISRDGALRWPWQHFRDWWRGFGTASRHGWLLRDGLSLGLALATLMPAFVAVTVVTFPAELLDRRIRRLTWLPSNPLRTLLFEGEVDAVSRRRRSPFSNTIIVSGFNFLTALGIDDEKKLEWTRTTVVLRGRRLERAVLDGAILRAADFSGAMLRDASLRNAQLQGASFDGAHLEGTSLSDASLEGASFEAAHLQGASLIGAHLQGATFVDAQLQGTALHEAHLQGASLHRAQLQGASLDRALLLGASLVGAQLQGASLFGAQLQGASLDGARLQGTSLGRVMAWRSTSKSARFDQLVSRGATWGPEIEDSPQARRPWTGEDFEDLRNLIDHVVPLGPPRNGARQRIARLNPNAGTWLDAIETWQTAVSILAATGTEDGYRKALAAVLRSLLCEGGEETAFLARNLANAESPRSPTSRLNDLGRWAPEWVEDVLASCSTGGLMEADKARLRAAAQAAARRARE